MHQTTKSFMTGSKLLQFEEWIFTKKWREACKLQVKVTIFPKSSKRDNPTAVLFRRSLCRGEPYGIDFCEKCAPQKFLPLRKSTQNHNFGHETGLDASSRAETLGIRSCATQGPFPTPPGLPRVENLDFSRVSGFFPPGFRQGFNHR